VALRYVAEAAKKKLYYVVFFKKASDQASVTTAMLAELNDGRKTFWRTRATA
jgi:hypothetical protein